MYICSPIYYNITRHSSFVKSGSSNFLRKALNKFSDDFSQKFESILPEAIVRDDDLAIASELIAEHFQFLPNYT